MAASMKIRTFITNNLVVLIMVPVLVGAHYGWYRLQQHEELVGTKERQLPLTAAFGKIFGGNSTVDAAKTSDKH